MISDDQLKRRMDSISASLEQKNFDLALSVSRKTLAAVKEDGTHIPEIQGVLHYFIGNAILSAFEEACHEKDHPNFEGLMTYWASLLPEGYQSIMEAALLLPEDDAAKRLAEKYDYLAAENSYFHTGKISDEEASARDTYFALIEKATHALEGEDFALSLECAEAALNGIPESIAADPVPVEVHALLQLPITVGTAMEHYLESYAGKYDESKDEALAAITFWAHHIPKARNSAQRALSLAPDQQWLKGIIDDLTKVAEGLAIKEDGSIGISDVDDGIEKLAFSKLIKNAQAEHKNGKWGDADQTLNLSEPLMRTDGNALAFHSIRVIFNLTHYGSSLNSFEEKASVEECRATLSHVESALLLSQRLGNEPDPQFLNYRQQLQRMISSHEEDGIQEEEDLDAPISDMETRQGEIITTDEQMQHIISEFMDRLSNQNIQGAQQLLDAFPFLNSWRKILRAVRDKGIVVGLSHAMRALVLS